MMSGDSSGGVDSAIEYPNIMEFTTREKLLMEREMTGIFISGHPLDPYANVLEKVAQVSIADILEFSKDGLNRDFKDGRLVQIAGIVMEKKTMITKNKNMMAFVKLEDTVGSIECVIFPNVYERYSKLIKPIDEVKTSKLYIRLDNKSDMEKFNSVVKVLSRYKGDTNTVFYFSEDNSAMTKNEICIDESKIDDISMELKGIIASGDIIYK